VVLVLLLNFQLLVMEQQAGLVQRYQPQAVVVAVRMTSITVLLVTVVLAVVVLGLSTAT
jgi:hypothetical protein